MSGDECQQFGCGDVGLYVHIPFCSSKCRYCGFYSELIGRYDSARLISTLISEISRYDLTCLDTVYVGGGSPSCLPHKELIRLIETIISRRQKPVEFTIEFNPGQADEDILRKLNDLGVNRLSIGTQSFNQSELDFLGRRHSVDDVNKAVKICRNAGFDNISLDLILAIPGSTLDSWQHTLKSAIALGVEHISAYSLSYEKEAPLFQELKAGKIVCVDEDTDRAMYETAIDVLDMAGIYQYEISDFARPGFECRHNLRYWGNLAYIGIGPAAASCYKDRRTTNIADINRYIEAIESGDSVAAESEVLTPIEKAFETAVLNLRRRCGIDIAEFERQTGFDATRLFQEVIIKYQELDLLEVKDGRIFLTRQALPIADSVLCDFSSK